MFQPLAEVQLCISWGAEILGAFVHAMKMKLERHLVVNCSVSKYSPLLVSFPPFLGDMLLHRRIWVWCAEWWSWTTPAVLMFSNLLSIAPFYPEVIQWSWRAIRQHRDEHVYPLECINPPVSQGDAHQHPALGRHLGGHWEKTKSKDTKAGITRFGTFCHHETL